MPLYQLILQAFFVSSACSMDCFVTGFAYGANKIKITLLAAFAINLICSIMLGLSLFLGGVLGNYIPNIVTLTVCVIILCFLGLTKILGSIMKSIVKRKNGINKDIHFSAFSLKFLLNISANPETADIDNSKTLSLKEAVPLAIALSLDGLAVGLGTGLASPSTLSYLIIIGFSLFTDIIFLLSGRLLGHKIAKKTSLNLSWLSGILLIGLALMKIFL